MIFLGASNVCPTMASRVAAPGCILEWYKDANGCDMARDVCPSNQQMKTDDPWQTRRFKLAIGLIALPVIIGLGAALFKFTRKDSL